MINSVKACVDRFYDKLQVYEYIDGSTDIVSGETSKWKAISQLLVDEDCHIVAFGNDENDEEMIKNSDFGVAVCSTNQMLDKWAELSINTYDPNEIVAAVDKVLKYYERTVTSEITIKSDLLK